MSNSGAGVGTFGMDPHAVGAYTIFTGVPVRVDEVVEEEARSRRAQDGEICEELTHDEHLSLIVSVDAISKPANGVPSMLPLGLIECVHSSLTTSRTVRSISWILWHDRLLYDCFL